LFASRKIDRSDIITRNGAASSAPPSRNSRRPARPLWRELLELWRDWRRLRLRRKRLDHRAAADPQLDQLNEDDSAALRAMRIEPIERGR
jgi:hypothetical protein